MSRRRLFEKGDCQSGKTTQRIEPSNVSSTRDFPINCGPFAPSGEIGSQDLSAGEGSSNLSRNAIVLAPPDVNFENVKPKLPDDCKVENVKQDFMAKDDEKLDPTVAFGKAKSENRGSGDSAGFLRASSQHLKFASIYPPPRIRKGVTVCRNFPPNCGENLDSFCRVALEHGRSNSETKPSGVIAESGNDQDCAIVVKQLNRVCNENVVEDEYEPSPITENTLSKQVQEPYECNIDPKEDEGDGTAICILTPSEWNQLQSGFKRQNVSKKDVGDESLVEEMGNDSEEYKMEGFAEPETGTTIENYHEEPRAKELKNLCIVPYDGHKVPAARNKVHEVLNLFEELYDKLERQKVTKQIHTEVAMILKNQLKWLNIQPIFGHVPGVEVGDEFQFRAQLVVVGLHREFFGGINCVTVDGKRYANSVVNSGRYANKILSRDVIWYWGQGGNPKVIKPLAGKCKDQKLEGNNLALKHSKDANLPIRVIRKNLLGDRKIYIYEGLYAVTKFWQERNEANKLGFIFQMVRISDQPENNYQHIHESRTSTGYLKQSSHTVINDLSQGMERMSIPAVNDMSDEKPQPFIYITKRKYPDWYRVSNPLSCRCSGGCSDSKPCMCTYKNAGEIPFNETGSIIRAQPFVHECGPFCLCPPSCQNRVSQRGLRFRLEVFNTKSTGWGVRSREDIPSGSFICEYIGEVLPDKEAEESINDEYLFDLGKSNAFTIDAAQYGNVGRFINHSCSPNLYAQNVLYDNGDRRLPHIMFFAAKDISAFQELSYHYNYKIGGVRDANGNIKKKMCHCGSRECAKRLY